MNDERRPYLYFGKPMTDEKREVYVARYSDKQEPDSEDPMKEVTDSI